ncbi:MAG: glycosyltransferase family 4 protein, partial [Chloroflexi bacterium]|nr:glycosyltransferase family 4 protein [Chloroflexota bacterium]
GVRVLRHPLYPDHSRSGIKRALSYLSFMLVAAVLGPVLCGKTDILWVYHPPLTTGVAGWWLSLWRRAPFVYEIQDMWPESLTATGMISNKSILGVLGRIARFIYRRARAMTVISPGFKENLITKGVPPHKVHVVPNWTDERIYGPTSRDVSVGQDFELAGRFNVVFAGNMGPAQGLQTVIEAAQQLLDVPEIQFVFIGDGLALQGLQESAHGLSNVSFIDRQPAENMPGFFAWADALLVHLRSDPLFAITIPSKTLAYLASGRPIICAVAGDGAEVVRQANAGLICPPEDPDALAKTVRTLYTMQPAEREAMGEAGRQAYLAHYRREKAVDRYEQLFEEIHLRRNSRLKR